jgi:D-glycero-alpha-D-manno-heptose-7-phosphate kinase
MRTGVVVDYIKISQYPYASVSQIQVPYAIWWELERCPVLIYLGKSHHSSQIHEMVIRGQEHAGANSPHLQALRNTALRSHDALYIGDFAGLGQAMIDNHEARRQLHPALISAAADRIAEIAKAYGAIGRKVNRAGGDGGSLTLLSGFRSEATRALIREIQAESALFKNILIYLSCYGLRVWAYANATRN